MDFNASKEDLSIAQDLAHHAGHQCAEIASRALSLAQNPAQYVLFHAFFLSAMIEMVTVARIGDEVPYDKGKSFEQVRDSILSGTLTLMDAQQSAKRKRAKAKAEGRT